MCENVWPAEIAKWTQFKDLRVCFVHGPHKRDLLDKAEHDVYLINPEGVVWLTKQYGWDISKKKYGKPLPFDVLAIDELTKFKNSQSERSKALRPALRGGPRWRWGLTGSLAGDGNYEDVFGQQLVLDDGAALGKYITHYRDKYFLPSKDGFNYDLREPDCERQILERLAPYWFYMDPADYTELPELVDDPIYITFGKAEWAHYRTMQSAFVAALTDGTITAANSGAAYSKLAQMANGAVYDEDRSIHVVHSLKLDALADLIEELNGVPLLIGYEFQHDLDRMRAVLGADMPHLGSGATTRQEREWIAAWNRGKLPYLAMHPASAAHGLNLQEANACHICWFSLCWSYEWYDQLIRRIRRDGNKALRIFNHMLIIRGTIDEEKLEARDAKDFTQRRLMTTLNRLILRERDATGGNPLTENETMPAARLSRPAGNQLQNAPPLQTQVQPAGWGAPPGGQPSQHQEQLPTAVQQPAGWGAPAHQIQNNDPSMVTAETEQRERIRQNIAPTPQEQVGSAFSPQTHAQAGAIQGGNYGPVSNGAVTSPTAGETPARRRSAKADEPDKGAVATVLAARVEILKVAFIDPNTSLDDGFSVANELWNWATNIPA